MYVCMTLFKHSSLIWKSQRPVYENENSKIFCSFHLFAAVLFARGKFIFYALCLCLFTFDTHFCSMLIG